MRILIVLALLVAFTSCVKNKKGYETQQQVTVSDKVFTVTEVIQTSKYTYLEVDEKGEKKWVAVTREEINPGEVFYYDKALEMNAFHSKELDKTFDVIFFINKISKTPLGKSPIIGKMPTPTHMGRVKSEQKSNVSVDKSEGELTIEQIFKNKENYSQKEIEIRGIVVKVNKNVMGKNWIHIQDGSNFNGSFDLTITSQDLPELNQEATFKGTLKLNKNFGSGYFYDVIIEEAVIVGNRGTVSL